MAPKAKSKTENEAKIAYSLRSRDVKTSKRGSEGKPSGSSKPQKEKCLAEPVGAGKEKEKSLAKPVAEQKKEKNNEKSTNEQRMYYIRWNGDVGKTYWNCSSCGKDLSNIDGGREYEVQNFHLSSLLHDEASTSSILPEVIVLPCSHVFHETCFSALHVTNVTNLPCPICAIIST